MAMNLEALRPLAWSEPGRTTREIRTGGWRTRRPVWVEATAPCRAACPAGEPIPRWIERARAGDWAAAWSLIRAENPFPAVMGRVCAHPCEAACNRGAWDAAVAVNALERFVGDWGLEHGTAVAARVTRRERVAVVGGGPAGLACAYHLARLGYRPTLIEARGELGGLLRYGIPEYRLPRAVLAREIELALGDAVDVETGRRLGADLAWGRLAAYDAVFLAPGAARALTLGVPGEEARGIADALEFLAEVNAGGRPAVGPRVAVVGGGSTAMDVARTARRLGAASVTVLALEPREAMPAVPEEVAQALAEGVQIVNRVGVRAFQATGGCVTAVATAPARLERTAGGAVVPVFEPGDVTLVPADTVLVAIGQQPDPAGLPAELLGDGGTIVVDAWGATPLARVFAGGDAASRQRTVAHAVGAGTRAARAIHARLSGAAAAEAGGWARPVPGHVVGIAEIGLHAFVRAPRAERPEHPVGGRLASFVEVVEGLAAPAALSEARRCFACGHCVACDTCLAVCPDMAVTRLDGGYAVVADHCKGCGLCARECPRGALHMEDER
jgi:NADPH-dependent glutamate synthase beta subunit-like oxidoreductase